MAVESSFWIRCESCTCRARLRPDRTTPIIQFLEPQLLVRRSASALGWTVDAAGRDRCPYCTAHSGPLPSGHPSAGDRARDGAGPCPLCVPTAVGAGHDDRHDAAG